MFPPCSNPQKPSSCNCPRRYSSTWRRSGRSLQSIAEFSSWGSRFEKSPPGTPGCRNSEGKGCVPSPRTKMGKSAIVVQLTSWQSCSVSELPFTCLALFRLYSLLPHNLVMFWNITLSRLRAKRAGPKGLRTESARAVTGRQCPHSALWVRQCNYKD